MPVAAAASLDTVRRYAVRRGFPALTGSAAQVDWAETIRMRLVKSLDSAIRAGAFPARSAQLLEKKSWMLEHTSAAWWIEQRHQKPMSAPKQRYAQALAGYAAIMRR